MSLNELAQAREHLSDAKLIAFLRAIGQVGDRPTSGLALGNALDHGRTLDELFTPMDKKQVPPRYRSEFEIGVEPVERSTYRIRFGLKGKNFGDGGQWLVSFDQNERVSAIEQEDYWWVKSESEKRHGP
jgi:hypothetical protein